MKYTGKALILAGILLFCGLVTLCLGWGILIKNPENEENEGEYEEKTYMADATSIETIQTHLSDREIQFEPGKGDKIEIVYWDKPDKPEYQITEQNNILSITRKPVFHLFSVPNIPVPFTENKNSMNVITVRVPEAYIGSYDLKSSSGLIALSNLTIEQELAIEITSGEIELRDLTCKEEIQLEMSSGNLSMNEVEGTEIGVRLNSGNASLSNIKGSGDCKVKMSSGSVSLQNLEIKGNVNLELTSGEVNGAGIEGEMITIDQTSGLTSISEVNVGECLNAYANSGGIYITLTDIMENYTITSDVTTGSCNLPEYFGNGDKKLNATVKSGEIDISFKDN